MKNNWTEKSDILKKLESLWKKGELLREVYNGTLFPYKIKIKGPSATELSMEFLEVIKWIERLKKQEKSKLGWGYNLIEKEINYKLSGKNSMPTYVVIETLDDAIKLLKVEKDVILFKKNVDKLLQTCYNY